MAKRYSDNVSSQRNRDRDNRERRAEQKRVLEDMQNRAMSGRLVPMTEILEVTKIGLRLLRDIATIEGEEESE